MQTHAASLAEGILLSLGVPGGELDHHETERLLAKQEETHPVSAKARAEALRRAAQKRIYRTLVRGQDEAAAKLGREAARAAIEIGWRKVVLDPPPLFGSEPKADRRGRVGRRRRR